MVHHYSVFYDKCEFSGLFAILTKGKFLDNLKP